MKMPARLALISCLAFVVACEDAVSVPPSAPVQRQAPFVAQQANLPPGGGYQPGWATGNPGATSIQAPPPAVTAAASASASPDSHHGGSVSNAQAVVAAMAPGFRRCYNTGLREESLTMTGSTRMTAKIDATGRVASVVPTMNGLSDKVVACVAAVVGAAQFAPPEGGGATVVIPVTFAVADPPQAPAAPPGPTTP
jgi:hypothetical protein